jgi:hypothetical protein
MILAKINEPVASHTRHPELLNTVKCENRQVNARIDADYNLCAACGDELSGSI